MSHNDTPRTLQERSIPLPKAQGQTVKIKEAWAQCIIKLHFKGLTCEIISDRQAWFSYTEDHKETQLPPWEQDPRGHCDSLFFPCGNSRVSRVRLEFKSQSCHFTPASLRTVTQLFGQGSLTRTVWKTTANMQGAAPRTGRHVVWTSWTLIAVPLCGNYPGANLFFSL